MKAAVIGLTVGERHAVDYLSNTHVQEVVLCDIKQKKMDSVGDKLGIAKRYTDYTQMLQIERPDIVSVCVSNFLHKQICLDAFRAGSDVLCEKPLARNAQEAEEIATVAKRCNRKLMVNFNRRYRPEARALKQLIEADALGDIYYATTSWKRARGVPWWYPLDHAKEKIGGGAFIDLGVHMLDLCLWLMDYPEPDYVHGKTFRKLSTAEAKERGFENFDAEDMCVATVSMKQDIILLTEISWASNVEWEEQLELRLYGTKGGAVIRGQAEHCDEAILIINEKGQPKITPIVSIEDGWNVRDAFVDAVIHNTEVPCTPQQAITVASIMDAVYRSSETAAPSKV